MEEYVFNLCIQSRWYASALKAGMERNVKYQPHQLLQLPLQLPLQKVIKNQTIISGGDLIFLTLNPVYCCLNNLIQL